MERGKSAWGKIKQAFGTGANSNTCPIRYYCAHKLYICMGVDDSDKHQRRQYNIECAWAILFVIRPMVLPCQGEQVNKVNLINL